MMDEAGEEEITDSDAVGDEQKEFHILHYCPKIHSEKRPSAFYTQ
jgi:hypothetical protein